MFYKKKIPDANKNRRPNCRPFPNHDEYLHLNFHLHHAHTTLSAIDITKIIVNYNKC